jgi:hypothetical protein
MSMLAARMSPSMVKGSSRVVRPVLAVAGDEFVGVPVGDDGGNCGDGSDGHGGGDPDQPACHTRLRRPSLKAH